MKEKAKEKEKIIRGELSVQGQGSVSELPKRSNLSPLKKTLPFVTSFNELHKDDLVLIEWNGIHLYCLPLAPVIVDSVQYLTDLKQFLRQNLPTKFLLGLNNAGHLTMVREMVSEECMVFVDYGLYLVNQQAAAFVHETIEKVLFGYSWIEAGSKHSVASNYFPTVPPDLEFNPPLFISRVEGLPGETKLYQQEHSWRQIASEGFSYYFKSDRQEI